MDDNTTAVIVIVAILLFWGFVEWLHVKGE